MPFISVIIPVYNVELYLEECLNSVINQSLRDIEIIIVNDGSQDKSREIAEAFSQKDSRITLVNKENGGLSSARNLGLRVAKGDYVGFVDSDDFIDSSMFEKLYKTAHKNNSDIVCCLTDCFSDERKAFYEQSFFNNFLDTDHIKDGVNFTWRDLSSGWFRNFPPMAWNKIYKREFLQKHNLKFPEGLCFEDNPFFIESFLKAEKISLLREKLYKYRTGRQGAIIVSKGEVYFDLFKIIEIIDSILVKNGVNDILKQEFINYQVNHLLLRLMKINKKLGEDFYSQIISVVNKMNEKEVLNPETIEQIKKLKQSSYKEFINVSK